MPISLNMAYRCVCWPTQYFNFELITIIYKSGTSTLKNLYTYVLFYKSENLATPVSYPGMATSVAKAQLPHSDVDQNLHHSLWSLQHVGEAERQLPFVIFHLVWFAHSRSYRCLNL